MEWTEGFLKKRLEASVEVRKRKKMGESLREFRLVEERKGLRMWVEETKKLELRFWVWILGFWG